MSLSEHINITIKEVTKFYHQNKGIESINLELNSGNLHVFTGKNGSGKSTLIKCMMNLVEYQGKINKRKYRIGYAPEKYIMPEFMTIKEFLIAIGRIKHSYDPYLSMELKLLFKRFDLESKINHPIRSLSNGMKQKVNVIQALINHPKIIILDEPLVGLDFTAQNELIKLIIELSKDKLVIVSTHFPEKFHTKRKVIHHFSEGKIR